MKWIGILLLFASVALVVVGFVGPLVLSFAAIASSDATPKPEELGHSVLLSLICLPAAAITAAAGVALMVAGRRRG